MDALARVAIPLANNESPIFYWLQAVCGATSEVSLRSGLQRQIYHHYSQSRRLSLTWNVLLTGRSLASVVLAISRRPLRAVYLMILNNRFFSHDHEGEVIVIVLLKGMVWRNICF